MKILFVTDLYPILDDKTIPKIIEDFALAFKKRGNDVFVIRANFLLNSYLRGHKYIPECETTRNEVRIYNKNFFLPFLDANIDYLNEKFDLIISHMPSGHIYADLINKHLKLPRISIVHQSDYRVLNNFKYAFYFKNRLEKALQNSTLIGARNKFLAEKLKADFILPSFVDIDKIVQNKDFKTDKLKLITLSKLIKRKNIDLVIKALTKIDFDFEYSIYGEGREEKKLEKLIKKYSLQNKIKIYPHIEHNKIWQKLDENNVFILPSINETFGISYLEAMSRGLITIGTIGTGIDGIIENNKNGYLIKPEIKDIKDVLEKIKKQNNNEIIKNSLLTIKNYTENEIMNKYDEVIKKIL
ncbi:MAG: glycosyltransferase family 4 protein [Candidatus Gastranaerophilales bacterium]|nr:glycosyltransferase family 4 protein [Candidatus Gastranaerophilales bacterium]